MHFEKIDKYLKPQSIDVSLCRPDKSIIAKLNHSFNKQRKLNLSSLNEFTFSLPFYIQDENHRFVENPLIKKTKARYLIRIEEIDGKDQNNQVEYYIIDNISKSMDDDSLNYDYHAFSLGHELADKTLKNFEVNGKNISDILNKFLFNTRWSVGYVDEEFITNGRSFNVSEKTYLDFIFEVAEKFNAVTQWDTVDRKINFVKPDNVGEDRGFRISYGKYLKSISEESNSNEMVTRLKLYGSEGLTVHSVNPIGVGYIEDFSYFMYPFKVDENGKITQHSYYMSDGLCKGLLDCQKLIKDTENEFKGYLDDLEVEQFNLRTKLNELSVLNTELSQIQAEIDITNSMQRDTSKLIPEKEAKQLEVNSKKDEVEQIESKISVIQNNVKDYRNKIDISNFITHDEQQELKQFIIEKEWTNDSITDANKLLEEGQKEFEKLREPQTVLNIDIINFYEIVDEFKNWSRMFLGDVIRINHERLEIDVKAKIISMDLDYEAESIKLEIANVKEILTDEDVLIKQLYKASQTSATINSDKYKWENASQKVTEVDDIINGKWDAIKREIEGGTEKDVSISKRGIIIRDLTDPSSYLIAQNAVLGITNDGGNTWKHAITKNGIVGENIYGKMFIGKNLIMENDSGKFRFDNDGVTIEGSALRIIGGLDEEQINGNFLKAGKEYNGTVIDSESGIVVTSSMNKTRTILNATEGIKIEANIGTSGNEDWVQRFYVDDKGDLYANDLYARRFRLLDDNGKIMIDGNTKTLNFAGFQNIDGTVPFKTVEGLPEEVTTIKQDTATAITDSSIAKQEANFAKTETINVKKDMEQMELEQIERDKQIQEQLKDKEMKMHRGNIPPLNPLVDQLWIDTSGTFNVIKRWDGAKWVNLAPEKASDIQAVFQEEYDTKMNEVMTMFAEKADLNYVDGKLITKIDNNYFETERNKLLSNIANQMSLDIINGQLVATELLPGVYSKSDVDETLKGYATGYELTVTKDGLVSTLNTHESRISQTEKEIKSTVKLDSYELDKNTLNAKITNAESNITQQALLIEQKVDATVVDDLTNTVTNYGTRITQTEKAIALKADKTSVTKIQDDLTGIRNEVSIIDTSLTVQAGLIEGKVDNTSYTADKEGMITRITNAESRIEQTELGLSSKVSNTVYEAGMQSLKDYVDIEDFGSSYKVFNNVHGNTFSGWSAGSLVIETSISWKSSVMCSIYIKGYNYLENNNDIDLNIGFYTFSDGVFYNKGYTNKGTMQITEVRIGVTSSNKIVLIINPVNFSWRYPKFIVDKFVAGGPASNFNKNWTSKITTDLSAYTNVVSLSSTVNLPVMSNRLSKAETDIVQTAEQVALKASKTELDSAKQDISKAQAQLTVQAGQIATKVEKNGVISAVNQTAEAYKIQASKLDLQGYATFSDLSTPGKTTISGSNVRTGTITVGGNANGNGQLEVVDANNGLIFRANQNGIVDTKGRELIGKGGVLSSFVFLGNTDYYGWQQVGWHGASVGFNVKSPVTFQIPQNFVITKAELRLESIPIYEFEDGVEKRGPLHCDSLKLYKVGDWSDSFFMTDWFEIYGETPRTSTHTDVTSQTFGRDTLNPSQEVNPHRIKGFTANIKNYVSSGVNKFYVGSSKAYNEAMSYGAIRLTVFVEGYIN